MQCNACGTLLPPAAGSCPKCGALAHTNSDYDAIPYIDEKEYQEQPALPTQLASSGTIQQPLLPVDPGKYPEQKRSQSIPGWMTALIILLALLLIIEGIGSVIYATNYRPTDLRAQATAVAQNFLTAQVNSTAQASAHATATANAMTPEQVYQQATSGTPIIDDPLKDDSGNVWYHIDGKHKDLCNFHAGAYHVQIPATGSGVCIGYGTQLNNLAFQTQIKIINGFVGGLVFHFNANSSNESFYTFGITTNGVYILNADGPQQTRTLTSGISTTIMTGLNRANVLTVIVHSSHIYLYINGQFIADAIDTTYISGAIGLIGFSNTKTLDVAFNNVKVWEL